MRSRLNRYAAPVIIAIAVLSLLYRLGAWAFGWALR